MEGFSSIVDSLGGVTVDNHMRFEYAGYDFDQGKLNLNGEEALAFSRMRFEDPRGFRQECKATGGSEGILNKLIRISTVLNWNRFWITLETASKRIFRLKR